MSERGGVPLVVGVSAANTNDSYALKPLVKAIPAIRSRRGPRRRKPGKLHADKAYDTSEKLGRHRWVGQCLGDVVRPTSTSASTPPASQCGRHQRG
jgi:hypothetical protein